jgi:uncharacterized protein
MSEKVTVRRIVGPTILMASGRYFDFEAPEMSDFTIDDIATGLSNTCRFAGQCLDYYSVAEHSVYVSEQVPQEHALAALMHDASEAFTGDMNKPLKGLLPEFRVIEKRIEAAVLCRFNIPLPLHPSIKEADIRMLATEQSQVMKNRDQWEHTHLKPAYAIKIKCLPPREAKSLFLERFAVLSRTLPAPPREDGR